MVPSLSPEPPEGDEWIHEIKYDGFRTELVLQAGDVRAFTRNGFDWTERYPGPVAAARDLNCTDAIFDGEMIVQDQQGRSDFHAFRSSLGERPHDLIFMAFDLLHLDGEDLRNLPLVERRSRLEDLIGCHDPHCCLQFSESVEGSGSDFFQAVDAMGLEGMVSKRKSSRYRSGRSKVWLKIKTFAEDEFVVIGTQRGSGTAPCAHLARQTSNGLEYAGTAFVTLPAADRERFWRAVEKRRVEEPPVPIPSKRATYIAPELKVRARFLRGEGALRHATLAELL